MKRSKFDLQQGSSKKQRLDQQTEETEEEAGAQGNSDQEVEQLKLDGSTRRYTLMINLLENIDREDLETLWKLVKDKYGNTRPEEEVWDQVHTFVPKDLEIKKEVMKRSGFHLQQESSKKQKLDQQIKEKKKEVEAQANRNQEIVNEGKISTYHITRADGSTKRYTSMINLLENIDRGDLKALWKLVKDKHGNTRPEEAYERVLWGDLKVMFEPYIESGVWRQLQEYDVTVWKLFSSSGVHFVRFKNLHIFMLVDKAYPLTPATITKMLERQLQADQWNEMCYQLLKLMLKQQRKR
nr:hypothetical protein [Tanacetum cinerariifolium]